MSTLVDENWEVLLSAFPSGWQELGRETGAIKHQLKEFRSESDLLRVLLIHVGKGYSLRETAVIAKVSGLAEVSDVALLKRLRKSENWFLRLCQALLAETGINTPPLSDTLRLRLVDGSIIKELGKTGSQWRLHFSFTLPEFRCDHFELNPAKGAGTGETFTKYPVNPGDYIMGDRGYSTAKGIEYIDANDAYVLVRVNASSLPLYDRQGESFNLLDAVNTLEQPFDARGLRWQVELIFKRLKSLLDIGHLPKFDPSSSRAWLYGKLFLALLTEKLARITRAFSPWGYRLPEPMA